MSKRESSLSNLALHFLSCCSCTAIMLALINLITTGPIQKAQQQKEKDGKK